MKLIFWVPLSIQGNSIIVKTHNGRWQATNVDNIPMHGVQIRMFQNLWDEWPSQQAFLKLGAIMSGLQVDDWVCFSVIYYAGSSLPTNFRDLQYAFLHETYMPEKSKIIILAFGTSCRNTMTPSLVCVICNHQLDNYKLFWIPQTTTIEPLPEVHRF